MEIRRQRNYEEEMKAEKDKSDKSLKERMEDVKTKNDKEQGLDFSINPTQVGIQLSSLILWSICPDGNSGEWLKLFDASRFSESFEYRKTFRKFLNQND